MVNDTLTSSTIYNEVYACGELQKANYQFAVCLLKATQNTIV
jgi:hypothetical protein